MSRHFSNLPRAISIISIATLALSGCGGGGGGGGSSVAPPPPTSNSGTPLSRIAVALGGASISNGVVSVPVSLVLFDASGNRLSGSLASPVSLTDTDPSGNSKLSGTTLSDTQSTVTLSFAQGVAVNATINATASGIPASSITPATLSIPPIVNLAANITSFTFFSKQKRVYATPDGVLVDKLMGMRNIQTTQGPANAMVWGTKDSAGNFLSIYEIGIYFKNNPALTTYVHYDAQGRPIEYKNASTGAQVAINYVSSTAQVVSVIDAQGNVLEQAVTDQSGLHPAASHRAVKSRKHPLEMEPDGDSDDDSPDACAAGISFQCVASQAEGATSDLQSLYNTFPQTTTTTLIGIAACVLLCAEISGGAAVIASAAFGAKLVGSLINDITNPAETQIYNGLDSISSPGSSQSDASVSYDTSSTGLPPDSGTAPSDLSNVPFDYGS